ncbi:MAG: 4a-hydroxytetrahydrobiopterin dehydratase [Candidatus Berkelbacteria bacterium]|nr:MAG: 4a-hydroxytetrahydrobiopterin dehydratase [Candidatus Berkelbacteria bacterium]QQG51497.1 MAG: 4a-hydroxytetrahydrobiopterin dehydratase [Candidatus Berkelbacteria bacterium]
MNELAKQKCVPCEGGVPPLKGKALEKLKSQLDSEAPGWNLRDAKHLEKTYKFPDFQSALEFVNGVGEIAESEGHHPNIEFGWGFVRIIIWTHKIDGLSESDFVLSAKIEDLNARS